MTAGSVAEMRVRLKSEYYKGLPARSSYNPTEEVKAGAALESDRKKLNDVSTRLSKKEWENKKEGMYKKEKNMRREGSLKIVLSHGDIVIIHGSSTQNCYEVRFFLHLPSNTVCIIDFKILIKLNQFAYRNQDETLRFALIASCIKPDIQVNSS